MTCPKNAAIINRSCVCNEEFVAEFNKMNVKYCKETNPLVKFKANRKYRTKLITHVLPRSLQENRLNLKGGSIFVIPESSNVAINSGYG